MKRETQLTELSNHVQKILACVSLIELLKHDIVHRLNGADHEQTSRFFQLGQMLFVLPQVLDLDRGVVGDLWKFPMKYIHNLQRMANAVEKIRIAKRNVLRPRRHLPPDVLQYH